MATELPIAGAATAEERDALERKLAAFVAGLSPGERAAYYDRLAAAAVPDDAGGEAAAGADDVAGHYYQSADHGMVRVLDRDVRVVRQLIEQIAPGNQLFQVRNTPGPYSVVKWHTAGAD